MAVFTSIPDHPAGYALAASDWDAIKDALNASTWVQLASSTLAIDTASIGFTGIDQTFAHLLLIGYLRSSNGTFIRARFNADTGANYDGQRLYGGEALAVPGETFAQTSATLGFLPGSVADANLFSSMRATIPHYANAASNKVALSRWGFKGSTSPAGLAAGHDGAFWRSNAAITSISLFPSAGNFTAGSRAALYGLA